MYFNLEVNNMILKEKKSHYYDEAPFCSFVFNTKEWKHLEKYAVFWTRKGKSTVRYLGTKSREQCPVPQMVLNDLYFYVQVYANDDVYTQKLKVFVNNSPKEYHKKNKINKKRLNQLFANMDKKIDKIIYDDNKFLVYANNTLIESFDIVDELLVSKILNEVTPKLITDTALSEDSDLPVSSKVIYQALQEKVNISDLPQVAISGNFNDLDNIPNEFPPAPHTHEATDIQNFESDTEDVVTRELDDFIDDLILDFEI